MHTTSEENKVLVRRFGEAMNSRQFHLLDELVAVDARGQAPVMNFFVIARHLVKNVSFHKRFQGLRKAP